MQNTLKKFIKRILLAKYFVRKENNVYLSNVKEPNNCTREYIDDFVEKRLSGTAAIRNVIIINTGENYLQDITLSSWAPIANNITIIGDDPISDVNNTYETILKIVQFRRRNIHSWGADIHIPLGVVLIPKFYNIMSEQVFDCIFGISLDGQILQLNLETGELKKRSIKFTEDNCFFIFMKEIK